MAESGITITGLDEIRAGVNALPLRVTVALRGVAQATAQRVMAGAKARLAAQTHGTGATAEAIHLVEDTANRMFSVVSPGVIHQRISWHTMRRSGRSHTQRVTVAMLPVWLEYGTVKMPARPYMRPAAEAENARYQSAMEAVALAPVREVFEK